MNTKTIKYPYLPNNRSILYVSKDNEYIKKAEDFAKNESSDSKHKTGAVVVKGGVIVGYGTNQTALNKKNKINDFLKNQHSKLCIRRVFKIKSGEKYWLCPGCASPSEHAEQRAIRDALRSESSISGADLYLWGHWWCCKPCWDSIIKAEIKNVFLLEDSENLFK